MVRRTVVTIQGTAVLANGQADSGHHSMNSCTFQWSGGQWSPFKEQLYLPMVRQTVVTIQGTAVLANGQADSGHHSRNSCTCQWLSSQWSHTHGTAVLANAVYESDNSPSLKLGPRWKDVILDPNLTNLYFDIHWKIRDNPSLAHHSLSCLVQLASLNGPVMACREIKVNYICNYLQAFIRFVSSVQLLDREALGISNIVRKVLLFYPPATLVTLPSDILQVFLQTLTRLTCFFAEGAAQEESVCVDDCFFMEAFDNMLKAWTTVLGDYQLFPEEFCKQSCLQIFNTYLQSHLSPPDGTRGTGRDIDSEEIDETEEDDQIKFRDQLQSIGVLGRQIPGHALPLLAKLLEERINRLHLQLQRMHMHMQGLNISESNVLDCLFEDIHWLLLITGN
ncbi:Exportin-4 [Homalodisca vitripennis]|nr:Exportin-4 [Homalodisca vitripennis]